MNSLTVCFSGRTPQLTKTIFACAHAGAAAAARIAVRGRDGGAYCGAGSFLWTPAVQGLSLLLLNAAATRSHEAMLVGSGKSPALSLSYAISKEPQWLGDVFGYDANGRCFAKRLFKRTNSEGKRPGPIIVALNERLLPATSIEVIYEGRQISDPGYLLSIASAIEEQIQPCAIAA